jgi:hypothetical protein
MKTYVIYGASDDLVEVEGAIREEYNCWDEHGAQLTLAYEVDTDHMRGGVRVHVKYELSGCWSVGISPLDEDIPIPADWTFELRPGSEPRDDVSAGRYTAVLFATVDDDVSLTRDGAED